MNLTINKFNEDIAFVLVSKEIECYIISDGRNFVEQYSQDEGTNTKLPPGNWQILFRLSEAKESDYAKIVEYKKYTGFRDYTSYPGISYYSQNEKSSMLSLLIAYNLTPSPNQDIIVIEKVK